MATHPFILVDRDRVQFFAAAGQSRALLQTGHTWIDGEGIAWLGVRQGSVGIGLTWLGPGLHFDPVAQETFADEFNERSRKMAEADIHEHQQELTATARKLRLGRLAERLLWRIHVAVLT